MKVELTWQEYVGFIVKDEIGDLSLGKFEKKTGISKATLSKVLNGKYIPDVKTLHKWFPKRRIKNPILLVRLDSESDIIE